MALPSSPLRHLAIPPNSHERGSLIIAPCLRGGSLVKRAVQPCCVDSSPCRTKLRIQRGPRGWPMSDALGDKSGEPKPRQQQQLLHDEGDGVLLYYKYIDLGEYRRALVKDWYLHQCHVDGLRGRVRVALDGVNCTLGGSLVALRKHMSSVKEHAILRGGDIDFKLSASRGARNSQAAQESGFTTLSVKGVKEVVSLGERGAGLSHLQGGRHVSPQEFHRLLRAQEEISARRHRDHVDANAGEKEVGGRKSMARELNASADAADGDSDSEGKGGSQVEEEQRRGFGYKADARVEKSMVEENEEKEAVLLDVRNVYETSIGHFSAAGVERLDPKTRQFSDLPKWVDENVDQLRGKRVLMYCTGGVRCEMASALIRRHCDADATGTEVLQLSGGIERYLQAYPQSREEKGSARAETAPPRAAVDLEVVEEGSEEHAGGEPGGNGGTRAQEGFFRGKNFVFDERVSVPELPAGGMAVGRCVLCHCPWDDYGSRSRCTSCRMLVLVCDACIERGVSTAAGQEGATPPTVPQTVTPESPRKGDTDVGSSCPVGGSSSRLPLPSPSPTTATRAPIGTSPPRQEDAWPAAAATAVTLNPQSTALRDGKESVEVGQSAELAQEEAKAIGAGGFLPGRQVGLKALLCSTCDRKRLQDARAASYDEKGES